MNIETQQEILDGLLLSDGGLSKSKKSRNARFGLTSCHFSFAKSVICNLPMLPWAEPYSVQRKPDKRTGRMYASHYARTRVSEFLTQQHKRWYPNGKKIVPKDIFLSDQCILWWYIGDGHLRRKSTRPNYRRIEFATDGFVSEDVDFLIDLLAKRIGNDSVYKERNEIMVGKQSLCKLIQILGQISPISDYQYKFEFGPYLDSEYWKKSFETRPLKYINEYRKKNRVREVCFKSKEEISHDK